MAAEVKPAIQTEPAVAAPPKNAKLVPVIATKRINGVIEPGQIFTPDSKEQRAELFALDAVAEPSDADLALHEKLSGDEF